MPRGRWPGQYPSRYQPLVDHLAARSEDEVVLTFPEIEALIGGALPVSASTPTYWQGVARVHTRLWRALGWRAHVGRYQEGVRFKRESRQEAERRHVAAQGQE